MDISKVQAYAANALRRLNRKKTNSKTYVSDESPETTESNEAHPTDEVSITTASNLFVLQDQILSKMNKGTAYAHRLLSDLEELQHKILDNALTQDDIDSARQHLAEHPHLEGVEELNRIIDDIELRLKVELAKLEYA